MTRHTVLRDRSLAVLLAAALLALGCAGGGAGGCTGLTPIPGGRFTGEKTDNAVNIRLSANGINYLNGNWARLIEMFAPGQQLTLPVPCTPTNIAVVGDVVLADQGPAGCAAESCGRMDGACVTTGPTADAPANVLATITGFQLTPQPPDAIQGTIQLAVNTGNIFVDTSDRSHGACAYLSPAKCALTFNTAATAPADNRLKATVTFSIDAKWDKLLAVSVSGLGGTEVCGSSGAAGPPECLQATDLSFSGQNNCGDVYCGVADWDPLKTFVLQLISPMIQTQIQAKLATATCQSCTTPDGGTKACPISTDGNNTQAACSNGVCMDPTVSGKCVPMFLGTEGRLSLGSFLGQFGAPADAQLDMSVAAGASVRVDQGVSIGTRAGFQAVTVANCVPAMAAPQVVAVAAPDFDAEASPGSTYHAGLGISAAFLNQSFHHAQQSGALCLALNTSNVGLINTGLFKTFLPSLGKLATRDGKDAPMMVVLRPARPPVVVVGKGTYNPSTLKPIEPLLTVSLPEVSIDFYAMLDDRYARLFTLTADISLPLSLIFQGCDSMQPALGDLRSLISNIHTTNSEMLAEDPSVLADLIPAVVGLAEPAVASALKPFALPTLGQFKLKVNEAKGLGNIAGTTRYNHLGIYAQLMGINDACATAAPKTVVALRRSVIPKAAQMRLAGHALPWPQAVLDVQALGKAGTPQFAWKVDEGLWTDFVAAPGGELVVSHPVFLIQGVHTIHVRSRVAEDPHGISGAVNLGFRVDWDAPEVALLEDAAHDRLVLTAQDVISPAGALEYAYQLGDGAVSEFGPPREISLSGVASYGQVTAFVRDEAQNVGQASWRAPGVAGRADAVGEVPAPTGGGCSASGGFELAALGLWAVLARRTRRP